MRDAMKCLAVVAALVSLPSIARAQNAALTGTVRDASGAVLPGVTVEASSDALIEKSRTAISRNPTGVRRGTSRRSKPTSVRRA